MAKMSLVIGIVIGTILVVLVLLSAVGPKRGDEQSVRPGEDSHGAADLPGATAHTEWTTSAQEYLRRGAERQRREDFQGAINCYDKALDLDPSLVLGYINRGIAKYRMGDFEGAEADCTVAVDLDPRQPMAYNNRGVARRDGGNLDLALADFFQAIELDPSRGSFYENVARVQYLKANVAEEAEFLQRALELNSGDIYTHIWLFLALERQGRDGATDLTRFRRSLQATDWPVPVVQMYLGEITPAELREISGAKNEKERISEVCYYLGEYYLLRGDKDKAKEFFKESVASELKTLPEYHRSKSALKRL